MGKKKTNKNRAAAPAYPGVPLERAVGLTRLLWRKQRDGPASLSEIAHHWEFSATNSAFYRSLEAAEMFGLLEQAGAPGSKQFQVTRRAMFIVQPGPGERTAPAVIDAALQPPIYLALWNHFRLKSPSDSDLEQYLQNVHNVAPLDARELINLYKLTLIFANLDNSGPRGPVSPGRRSATTSTRWMGCMPRCRRAPRPAATWRTRPRGSRLLQR